MQDSPDTPYHNYTEVIGVLRLCAGRFVYADGSSQGNSSGLVHGARPWSGFDLRAWFVSQGVHGTPDEYALSKSTAVDLFATPRKPAYPTHRSLELAREFLSQRKPVGPKPWAGSSGAYVSGSGVGVPNTVVSIVGWNFRCTVLTPWRRTMNCNPSRAHGNVKFGCSGQVAARGTSFQASLGVPAWMKPQHTGILSVPAFWDGDLRLMFPCSGPSHVQPWSWSTNLRSSVTKVAS